MTIDERIEALTHSVELMASMQHDHERRFQQHDAKMVEILERLSRIIDDHETRLNDLEGGRN